MQRFCALLRDKYEDAQAEVARLREELTQRTHQLDEAGRVAASERAAHEATKAELARSYDAHVAAHSRAEAAVSAALQVGDQWRAATERVAELEADNDRLDQQWHEADEALDQARGLLERWVASNPYYPREPALLSSSQGWLGAHPAAATPATPERQSVQAMVRRDLVERECLGVERYGTALYPHNGRKALQDAYEEALDLAQYLKQELVEQATPAATGAEPRCKRCGMLQSECDLQRIETPDLFESAEKEQGT